MSELSTSEAAPTNPYEAMMPAYERWALPVSTQIANAIIQHLGNLENKRLLDVGAGVGSLAIPASRAGAEVVAIDNAAAMVTRLRKRLAPFPQSRAEMQNVRDLHTGVPEYDVVASILSAAFMPDAQDVFAQMASMTKDGGATCVASWGSSYGSPIYRILASALNALPEVHGLQTSPGLTRFLDASELEQALLMAGCENVAAWSFNVACELPPALDYQAELEAFLRVVPAYAQLSSSQKTRLQPLIEAEYQIASIVEGKYTVTAPANIAIGRVNRVILGPPR